MDFTVFYEKYEALTRTADEAFASIRTQHGDCVTCHTGCSDCCYALFDLTLIEAMYINHRFRRRFSEAERGPWIERASKIDRQLARLKRQAYKRVAAGEPEETILQEMAETRMRCPLLDDENMCALYDHRPITCRLYGVPTSIHGKAHTCGLTRFDPGQAYPTVKLEALQSRLFSISAELVQAIGSKYTGMSTMLVPLSMALLTDYNDDYLGIPVRREVSESKEATHHG